MDFFSEKDLLYPSFSDSDSDEEEPKAPIPRLAVNNRHSNGKYYYPTSLKYNSNISKAILTGIVGDNNDSLVTNYNGKNGIHKPVEYVNHGKNGKSGHVSTNYGSSNAQTTIDANNPQQSFFVPDPSKSNDRTEMDEELHPLDNSFQFLDDDVNLFGFDDYMFGNEPIPLDPSTNASLPTKQNDTNTSYQLDSTKSMVNLPPLPVIPLTNTSYEYYEQQLLQLNGNNGNNSNSNKNNRNKSINTNNLRRAKPSLPPTLPPCRSGQQKLNQAKLSEIYRVKDQEYSKIYFGYLPEKYGK